jgi:hypothetical protein
MSRSLRDRAIEAISVCDQIEAHIQHNDLVMVGVFREYLQRWAADAQNEDLLVWCQAMRAKAERILAGDDEEFCEGV